MERAISLPVGIIVERRRIRHPWQEFAWRPVEVVPHTPAVEGWRLLREADGRAWFLMGPVPIELHRSYVEAYLYNLEGRAPVVYVALRACEGDPPWRVHLATVAPFEAAGILVTDEDIVEAVAMPTELAAWVRAFVERHPDEASFVKRPRSAKAPDKAIGRPLVTPAHARPGGRHG